MNNVEIIKGIDLALEGLKTIREALMSEEKTTTNTDVAQIVEFAPVNPDSVATGANFSLDIESLKAMKYNDFKKVASSLGVKCTGTREEILARIVNLNTPVMMDKPNEIPSEEEAPVDSVKEEVKPVIDKKTDKKPAKEDIPTKDVYDEQAEEIASCTPVEDIIEALADVEIKATKKNAVTLLAQALREGLIELEEDDDDTEYELAESDEDEEVEDVEEADVEEEVDINACSYFPKYDPKGYNDPKNMTEERAKAVKAKMLTVMDSYYDDELGEEDLASYIEDNATEEEIELLGEEYTTEDLLMFYMELVKRTIDNEGEEHEPAEPYEVADMDVCCGHELKYVKKTKKYICEHCGTEYEAE